MQNNPKLALIGYGAMGRETEKMAVDLGFEVTETFEIETPMSADGDYEFDVAIDFSFPEAVAGNVKTAAELGKNIVVGATGWYQHMEELEEIVKRFGTGMVWASNFSIGMRMFFRLAGLAADMVNNLEDYDIMLHEMHHGRKKDAPSGTAVSLGNIIRERVGRKENVATSNPDYAAAPDTLHISSTRGGSIPGTHTIYLDSPEDTIELTHRARNRAGFARGAVEAARWIHGRKGFYEFSDVMSSIFGEKK
jgi:4-hydroxy-tetrahydrodipicolinate reductase